jgi:putative glutamine amidotransferase
MFYILRPSILYTPNSSVLNTPQIIFDVVKCKKDRNKKKTGCKIDRKNKGGVRMGKPMIGVLPLYDEKKESYWMLPGYMKAVEEAGGIPVMLPLTTDERMIKRISEQFDAFLFTGGHDIDPSFYNEPKREQCGVICAERDEMEKSLFKYVAELDKPMLGICRGMQLFNVVLGGSLYQDLPTEWESTLNHLQKPPYSVPVHDIYIEKDSVLHDILKTETVKVNSYHHQGIKKLADSLTPVAAAGDGLVEAVVMPDKKFVLAVQWHPEYSYKHDEYNHRLFSALIASCNVETEKDLSLT